MPYVINNTSGDTTFYVQDGTIDRNSAVTLVGRNTPDYGEVMNENFIALLENHANDTAPNVVDYLKGQLWYDSSTGNDVLRLWDGASTWGFATKVTSSASAPDALNSVEGNMYFDTNIQKNQVKISGSWVNTSYAGEINDDYGTRVRSIILRDSGGVNRAVLAFTYANDTTTNGNSNADEGTTATNYGKETIMMIISEHDAFVAENVAVDSEGESINWYAELTGPGGIGVNIRKGINVRCDSTTNATPGYVSHSERADKAFSLNTGTYDSSNCLATDSANSITIDAANVAHTLADYIPQNNTAISLGNITNQFDELYVSNVYFSGNIQGSDNTVTIGSNTSPITQIFVDEITVQGNINIDGDNVSIGEPDNPVSNVYAVDVYASNTVVIGNTSAGTHYVFPEAGANNSILVADPNLDLQWLDLREAADVTGGDGISVSQSNVVQSPSGVTTTNHTVEVDILPDEGLRFIGGKLAVEMSDFTTSDLAEGSNLYHTTARVRQVLGATAPLTYNEFSGSFGVDGDKIVGSVIGGNGIETISLNNSGVIITSVIAKLGAGLEFDSDNAISVDTDALSASGGLFTGSTTNWGTVAIDNGAIKITNVKDSQKLGNQNPGYYLNTSSTAQTKSGSLTAGGVRVGGNAIYRTDGGTLNINNAVKATGKITATDICSTSDISTKSNIEHLDDCLDLVNQMSPKRYTQYGEEKIGFIAQQMRHVIPEIVHEDSDGLLGIDYAKLSAVFAGAIQDLQAKVRDLEKKLGK